MLNDCGNIGNAVANVRAGAGMQKTSPGDFSASIIEVAGVPRIAIGGVPRPATAVMPRPTGRPGEALARLREFRDAGVMFSSDVWTMTDRVRYEPRQWWLDEGEYDFRLFDALARALLDASPDGFIFPRIKIDPPPKWAAAHPEEMEDDACAKASSRAWRALYRRMLADMVAHVEQSDYADRIVGYHLGAFHCGEWLELGQKVLNFLATPADRADTRNPMPEYQVDRERHAKIAEAASAVADACIDAAACVKEFTRGRKLVGAFFGYPWLSHEKMMRVIESGQVDFFAAPLHYSETREPGRSGRSQAHFQATYRLHGRVYYEESDFRTFLSLPNQSSGIRRHPLDEAVGIVRRSIGKCLAGGWENWWFLLGGNDTFSAPELMESIRIGTEEERETMSTAIWRPAEVAVFTSADEPATSEGAPVAEFWRQCRMRLHADVLPSAGVPFDSYELSDIADPRLPDYRVYVFPNAFTLSEAMRAKIKERVGRKGKTAVWIFAPGFFHNGVGDKANVEDMTGMSLERRPLGHCMFVSWMLEPTGAGVRHRGQFATVERDGARNVFFPLPPTAAALREAFREAGTHVWMETDDILSAGRGYVMLHASSDGEKTIHLPTTCDVREIFGATPAQRNVREIVETLKFGETRVYFLRPLCAG